MERRKDRRRWPQASIGRGEIGALGKPGKKVGLVDLAKDPVKVDVVDLAKDPVARKIASAATPNNRTAAQLD
jgi:hypothetical protein